MVYHDSCYLGRYNDIYDPQRDIIDALPDVERVETERNKQIGLCCGAGGGQMWMEMDIGERMNNIRTEELASDSTQGDRGGVQFLHDYGGRRGERPRTAGGC